MFLIRGFVVIPLVVIAYIACWRRASAMRMLGLILMAVSSVVIPSMYYIIDEGGFPASLILTMTLWAIIAIAGLITFLYHRKPLHSQQPQLRTTPEHFAVAEGENMSIIVTCRCGARCRMRAQDAGRQGKCRDCGQIITIPLLSPPTGQVPLADQPRSEAARPSVASQTRSPAASSKNRVIWMMTGIAVLFVCAGAAVFYMSRAARTAPVARAETANLGSKPGNGGSTVGESFARNGDAAANGSPSPAPQSIAGATPARVGGAAADASLRDGEILLETGVTPVAARNERDPIRAMPDTASNASDATRVGDTVEVLQNGVELKVAARHPGKNLPVNDSASMNKLLSDTITVSLPSKSVKAFEVPALQRTLLSAIALPELLTLQGIGDIQCTVLSSLAWKIEKTPKKTTCEEIGAEHAGSVVLLLDRMFFAGTQLEPGNLLYFDGRNWTPMAKAKVAEALRTSISAGPNNHQPWLSCCLVADEEVILGPFLCEEFAKWIRTKEPSAAQLRALVALRQQAAIPLLESVREKVQPDDKDLLELGIKHLKDRASATRPMRELHLPAAGPAGVPKELRWAVIITESGVLPADNEGFTMSMAKTSATVFKVGDQDGLHLTAFALKLDKEPLPIKRIVDLVGEPDKVERGDPATHGGNLQLYAYGPIRLSVDPASGNVAGLTAPIGMLKQGLRTKAQEVLAPYKQDASPFAPTESPALAKPARQR